VNECTILTGQTINNIVEVIEVDTNKVDELFSVETQVEAIIADKKESEEGNEEDEDDGEVQYEKDSEGNLIRTDEKIKLDDGFDDTMPEAPEDYHTPEPIVKIIEPIVGDKQVEDKWGF
jgi:hypothetical protein